MKYYFKSHTDSAGPDEEGRLYIYDNKADTMMEFYGTAVYNTAGTSRLKFGYMDKDYFHSKLRDNPITGSLETDFGIPITRTRFTYLLTLALNKVDKHNITHVQK